MASTELKCPYAISPKPFHFSDHVYLLLCKAVEYSVT